MKKPVLSNNAPAPIGPYSQAIEAGGFLYVSGQLGLDPASGEFVSNEVKGQTEQALKNLVSILDAAGCTLDNVVKSTVFLKDIGDFANMNEVYAAYFKGDCPARSAVEVANLPKAGLVEIEVVAYKG